MDEISALMKKNYHHHKNVELPVIDDKALWELMKKQEKTDILKVIIQRCEMSLENYNIDFILRLFGWTIGGDISENESLAEHAQQL